MENIDVKGEGRKLFHEYIQGLVDVGWKKKQLISNVFVMTDKAGKRAFFTCYWEKPFADREQYYIHAKAETEEKKVHTIYLGMVSDRGVFKD
ncbi:hypothetical protein LHV56_19255 [Peribacillus frigoritolerans]|uniref:hypothetical protein n=1 Tax=Peribacillus frigoritolerans TaxID=450367 RepID=UPI002079ABDD|nr:hypothetical protein [Peribacillus frigoritolerans]USK78970.1 hypothetical protein LHV56_19255 [Peribacillus frigoritolerans]